MSSALVSRPAIRTGVVALQVVHGGGGAAAPGTGRAIARRFGHPASSGFSPRGRDHTSSPLVHTSGLARYVFQPDYVERSGRPQTAADLVQWIAEVPLAFEPGARSAYSNANYAVLARVIELASGQSYGAFLEQQILAPAGLTNTGHRGDADVRVPGLASGYVPTGMRGVGDGSAIRSVHGRERALAVRGESPVAFVGRCIPAGGVAPPSNIPDILRRRVLHGPSAASTQWRLGATRDLHHGRQDRPTRRLDGPLCPAWPGAKRLIPRARL